MFIVVGMTRLLGNLCHRSAGNAQMSIEAWCCQTMSIDRLIKQRSSSAIKASFDC
jgi:hypothetical protein